MPNRLLAIFLMAFGSLFVVFGAVFGFFGARGAAEDAARAEQLTPISAAALADSPVGRAALAEGRISDRNPTQFRDFVAYLREEYHGTNDNGDPNWTRDEEYTPPLLIEVGDGLLQVANQGYRLISAPITWQEQETPTWSSVSGSGTKRYRGFAAGSPVVMVGTVVAGSEGPELAIEFLAGGTRAEYIAARRGDATTLPLVGIGFGGLGLLCVGIGVAFALRGRRRRRT